MTATAQTPSIQLDSGSFKVIAWSAPQTAPPGGWPSVLAVYAGAGDVPPMLGTYAVDAGALAFRPAFPFASGVRYRAIFRPPGGGTPIEMTFDGPPRETEPRARVERVYPSGDVLPSNQLRVYIYFSAPMSRGEAESRVRILDEQGTTMEGVFLPGSELWDPSGRRLTLTLDPGRIKRGLTSNMTIGPPIDAGKRYTLVIDRDWPDARGVPMVEGFRKSFRGGPADRHPPDPKEWRMTPPRAGTTEPLVVEFPDPMNYPLLERMLKVTGAQGNIAGAVSIDRHETRWRLTPRAPWKAGAYQLVAENAIEDLAGNHIGEAFDIDVIGTIAEHNSSGMTSRPFIVR
jgi:hypothetical protein